MPKKKKPNLKVTVKLPATEKGFDKQRFDKLLRRKGKAAPKTKKQKLTEEQKKNVEKRRYSNGKTRHTWNSTF